MKRKKTPKVGLIISTICLVGMTLQTAQARGKVVQISKGQAAPSDGVFYPKEAHAKLVAKLKGMEAKCQEQVKHAVSVATLKLTTELNKWKVEAASWKRQLSLSEDFTKNQRKMLLEQVAKSQRIAWYKKPWFVATVTVVLTVGVAAFSVWSFKELAENR
jgi:hypothetical protein